MITYKSNIHAYFCKCGKSLDNPQIVDAITELWIKPISFPKVNHQNMTSIKIIDYYNFREKRINNVTTKLNENLQMVLKDLFFNGFSSVLPAIKLKNENYVDVEAFFAKQINEFIINKYGIQECKRNYFLPEGYGYIKVTDEIKENYNLELIAYYFLMTELLGKDRIDLLYHYDDIFVFSNNKDSSSYRDFIRSEMNHICNGITDYIYKKLIYHRHAQIKNFMLDNEIIPETGFIVEFTDDFPTFVMVSDQDGYIYLYE